jgi:hypothetical protein
VVLLRIGENGGTARSLTYGGARERIGSQPTSNIRPRTVAALRTDRQAS